MKSRQPRRSEAPGPPARPRPAVPSCSAARSFRLRCRSFRFLLWIFLRSSRMGRLPAATDTDIPAARSLPPSITRGDGSAGPATRIRAAPEPRRPAGAPRWSGGGSAGLPPARPGPAALPGGYPYNMSAPGHGFLELCSKLLLSSVRGRIAFPPRVLFLASSSSSGVVPAATFISLLTSRWHK